MGIMNTVKINAYAKLNLTLDVKGVEGGYHMLDSLVTTVDIFDRIVIKKRKDTLVSVVMHGMGSEQIEPQRNNAQLAAEAFVGKFQTKGVDVTIYKNIPIGAGMGGSSADAAAVIVGMGRLYSVDDFNALKEVADMFGSDTGYLLTGGLARICGRGDKVFPLPFCEMHFLILCPKEGVSTRECFAAYDELGLCGSNRTGAVIASLRRDGIFVASNGFGNDLFVAAKEILPDVAQAYDAAKSFSPLGMGMTGSGSAVFALFSTPELAAWAKSRYRGKFRAYTAKSVLQKNKKFARNPFVLGEGEEELWQKRD